MLLMPPATGAPDSTSDWDLLNRVRKEPDALDLLFRRHRDFVYRLAYSRLRDRESAEDVTQEVFYRLARSRRRFFKGAQFRTWLYRVVMSQVSDVIRRSRIVPTDDPDQLQDRGAAPEIGSDLDQLLKKLESLPDRQRQTVVLRLLEGFSTQETAAALKISAGSVKTHLHRAVQRLRDEFNTPLIEETTP